MIFNNKLSYNYYYQIKKKFNLIIKDIFNNKNIN